VSDERETARLVILDSSRRLLLFRHVGGNREFWATPGGGVERGETMEQAARREAVEELGCDPGRLRLLWTGHATFEFEGRLISQTETFFLVTRHPDVLPAEVAQRHVTEGIAEVRWWSVDEIRSSSEPIFPPDLAERIESTTQDRFPNLEHDPRRDAIIE
jgi:ADP-ribose pyrophosphatase YjhB (NUDIX family)